jgi:hypothetical protein
VGVKQTLQPYQAIPYTWDEPSKFTKLVVEIENSTFKKEFNLNIIRTHEPFEVHLEVSIVRLTLTELQGPQTNRHHYSSRDICRWAY